MKNLTTLCVTLAAALTMTLAAGTASAQSHGRAHGHASHGHSHTTTHRHRAPTHVHRPPVHVHRAPTHVHRPPVHVVRPPVVVRHTVVTPVYATPGPSPGYLRDLLRDAELEVDSARARTAGAETPEVLGYLRDAEGYLERAERLYLQSPRRYGAEIEDIVDRSRVSSRRAIADAERYEREIIELSRTARVEFERLLDGRSFYRGQRPALNVGAIEEQLAEAQRLLRAGEVVFAHRRLDEALHEIRRAERELNRSGYFRDRG